MQHSQRVERGVLVIAFEGDVDLEHSPTARDVLLDGVEQGKGVCVDLSAVTYIDSSGVASLVEAFQAARQKQASFALVSVNPAALRVLQLARLDKVFVIHDTLAEGLDAAD
ncbi:MAG: STAS domain-containing protein [Myxococcota bacterium]